VGWMYKVARIAELGQEMHALIVARHTNQYRASCLCSIMDLEPGTRRYVLKWMCPQLADVLD